MKHNEILTHFAIEANIVNAITLLWVKSFKFLVIISLLKDVTLHQTVLKMSQQNTLNLLHL